MDLAYLVVLGFAPALFWVWYFYMRDRCRSESPAWMLWLFVLGMAMIPLAALLEGAFEPLAALLHSTTFISIAVAPVVEELVKFLVVYLTVYKDRALNDPMDGIVYSTTAALGFAALENFFYVFGAYQELLVLPFELSIVRALLSVPGHALISSMWGYALGQAIAVPREAKGPIILQGLLLAIIFHAIFNLLVSLDQFGFAVMALVLVPLMWLIVSKRINALLVRKFCVLRR
jgi:RsiW-degrading membrane proteinase PrsW (M82 family)